MTSFLQYKAKKQKTPAPVVVPVVETTVPVHLQHHADMWDHHSSVSEETHDKMSEAMGGYGHSFTHFPLDNDNHHDIDPDVAEHLTKHNYQVKDYAKGIATTKKMVGDPDRGIPMREKHVEEKIGSILEKTKAPDDVKKSFMNDPARAATKSFAGGGHHVVITHSALGVAGMTTGTSWKNQSCMNMEGGSNAHKLRDDSEHGTHVAYLVHHDDTEAFKNGTPSKPIARIALKPYHEDEDNHDSDTIFRPETVSYGAGSTKFSNAVSHWASTKYPAKEGVEYTKNSNVYDDSDNSKYTALSKHDVEHAIDNGHDIVAKIGQAVDKSIIDHAFDHAKKNVFTPEGEKGTKQNTLESLAEIGNLNTTHVAHLNHLAREHKLSNWGVAVKHGDKFSSAAIKDHIDKLGENIPNRMLMNAKLPPEVVDKLPNSSLSSVRRSLIKPHHIDKVVDGYTKEESGSFYNIRDHASMLTKDHLTKIVKADDKKANRSANALVIAHPEFTQEHHNHIMNHMVQFGGAIDNHSFMRSSKYATVDDAKKLHSSLSSLAENEHLSTDTAKEVKDRLVKNASLVNGKGAREISEFGYNGGGISVPTQISKHLTDSDYESLAKSGKGLRFSNPDHSEKHLQAIHTLVSKADTKLDDHVHDTEDEHGDHEGDEKSEKLKEELDNHVANYARNIENHIDHHVDDGDGHIGNWDHHSKVEDHLENIEKLDHYATENNNPHPLHRDADHFFNNVQELHEKMHDLKQKTDEREYGDDRW